MRCMREVGGGPARAMRLIGLVAATCVLLGWPIACLSGGPFQPPSTTSGPIASATVAASTSPSTAVTASAAPSVSASAPVAKPAGAIAGSNEEAARAARRRGVLRVLLGLMGTVILAIIAAHPRVRAMEGRFGLTIAVASGLPFTLLGAIFQHPAVGVLDEGVLRGLSPFIEVGLGWVGFVLGFELDVRKLDDLPEGTGGMIAVETLIPFALVAATFGGVLHVLGFELRDPRLLRDALVVAAAGAVSASTAPLVLARGAGRRVARILDRMAQLDDVAPLVVLVIVGAWFRPVTSVDWKLPSVGWLFVAAGLGCVLGLLGYALIRGARNEKEELALILGTVAFSAGVSARLALSPLVVCAVAGALLSNLPRRRDSQLLATLHLVERPLVLLFMLFAGATASFGAWQGWALMAAYVLARAAGKIIGAKLVRRIGPTDLRSAPGIELALMPQSPIAIATMLAASALYGNTKDPALGWAFTAVLVGMYVNDVIVQIVAQRVNHLSTATMQAAAASLHIDPDTRPDQEEPISSSGARSSG